MPKVSRAGVVLKRAAFMAGWAYRAFVPKVVCPQCGSGRVKRAGGGVKRCGDCSYTFFAQLPEAKTPGN